MGREGEFEVRRVREIEVDRPDRVGETGGKGGGVRGEKMRLR